MKSLLDRSSDFKILSKMLGKNLVKFIANAIIFRIFFVNLSRSKGVVTEFLAWLTSIFGVQN